MKKFACAFVALLVLMGSPAFAQVKPPVDPATSAAVRKMLVVMDYRSVMKASMAQMTKSMPEVMLASFKGMIDNDARYNSEQRKLAMKEFEKKMPIAFAKVNQVMIDPAMIDEMIEAMVPVWSRIYTLNEIEQLTAFYASPVGRKTLTSMPQMMAEGMEASQQIVTPRINAVMSDVLKSFEK